MWAPARVFRVALIERLADLVYEPIVQGVLQFAEHADHWRIGGKPYWPFVAVSDIHRDRFDGVIGHFNEQAWVDTVLASGVPAVTTSNLIEELRLPRVASDESAIGRIGAEHLLERGFEHFGFVGPAGHYFSMGRYEAFRRVIERAGRTLHACMDVTYADAGNAQRLGSWLQSVPKPIAVMAAADLFGADVIQAAAQVQMRVPEDVAVLGVDNNARTTSMTRPLLSSIQLDGKQIGYRAAKLLDDLMRGESPAWPQWVPPVGVVARRSTDIELTDDPLVRDALRFIRDNATTGLRVEDVLDELDVSRRTLENRMKRAIGRTPQVAIQQAQIKRAKSILQGSRENLGAVARACGFDRQDQFCAVFKRLTGATPGEYRRQFTVPDGSRE